MNTDTAGHPGLAHPTVVPANGGPATEGATDEETENAGERATGHEACPACGRELHDD